MRPAAHVSNRCKSGIRPVVGRIQPKNGFLSPNDIYRLENMDLIPAEDGGDDYYMNGGYVKLKDAGKFAQVKQGAVGQGQTEIDREEPLEEGTTDSESRRSESTPQKPRERKR